MERRRLPSLERIIPLLVGVTSAGLAYYFLPSSGASSVQAMAKLDRLVGPVFDAATFAAGSLFAVYVLALSRAEGFLGQIFKTKTFRIFNSYVTNAIALSLGLVVFSIWLIFDGQQSYSSFFEKTVVIAWIGLASAMFASVVRAVALFLIIARSGSTSPLAPGPKDKCTFVGRPYVGCSGNLPISSSVNHISGLL